MAKITFTGAGSTVFARRILGDVLFSSPLRDSHLALYDIDAARLRDCRLAMNNLNENLNKGRAKITAHLGTENRRAAFKDADFIINAIQVGGYPSTVVDFEIPKKYGLHQTIGDTIGIGGIFRGLRTIPVLLDFARDIEEVCPGAWFLNYTNPMSILTGAMLRASNVKTVGLCHSVQVCTLALLRSAGMNEYIVKKKPDKDIQWKVAGINHMSWLLEITHNGRDLYPEIKKRAERINRDARKNGAVKHDDMVRLEIMRHFGYYVTESSEHNAEYSPYWIKQRYPELIEEFNIPLDEYPRRCIKQMERWETQRRELVENKKLKQKRSHEYGASIIEAIVTDKPVCIHGNILNNGLITNLADNAVVEVPCLIDRNGVQGCFVGELPVQCAALNNTNINVHLMTIEAALTKKREAIYQAAMLDPHTAAELPLDKIKELCDDLIKAHGKMLPVYK